MIEKPPGMSESEWTEIKRVMAEIGHERQRRREAAVVGQRTEVGDTGDGDDAGHQVGVLAEVDAVDQVAVAVDDARVGALAVDHLGGQIALPSVSADDAVVQGQCRADGAARFDVVAKGQGVDAPPRRVGRPCRRTRRSRGWRGSWPR